LWQEAAPLRPFTAPTWTFDNVDKVLLHHICNGLGML
jgi:hypothetical protein